MAKKVKVPALTEKPRPGEQSGAGLWCVRECNAVREWWRQNFQSRPTLAP